MTSAENTELNALAQRSIDGATRHLISAAKTVYGTPETGFNEHKTSNYVLEQLRGIGLSVETGIARTGMKAVLHGSSPGPTVAVIAELDALRVPGHPGANAETGAAHACGHHAQIGSLLGVAMALNTPEIKKSLSGNVAFIITPAEEFIDIGERLTLKASGAIEFLSGKQEMIRLGIFDDVDMAMMTHTSSNSQEGKIAFGGTNNGMVAKRIRFLGRASHAGGAPWLGVNALNAAMIAMSGIHAQRETYQDAHTVRIHPIITQGGVAVSSVPADVRMETYVRGANTEGFLDASTKVDRALRAGAMAVGGSVEITTLPGYLPIQSDESMLDLYKVNAASLVGEENLVRLQHRTGSTDMGDVSQLMPVIHPYVVAATGNGHGIDYVINDYEQAVIRPAKAMAMAVIDLLADGAAKAKEVLASSPALMTKRQYLRLQEKRLTKELYEGK